MKTLQLDLQNTLVPQVAIGSPTATFTRATTAYFQDFEGIYRQAISGEARFMGARRVRNILRSSTEDASSAAWVISGAGVKANVGSGVISITNGGVAGGVYVQNASTGVVGRQYIGSIDIRSATGSSQTVRLTDPFSSQHSKVVTVTTSWQRFATSVWTANSTSQGLFMVNSGGATFTSIEVRYPMVEDVTGQANQNPSDYISVGVLSAPYYGAGVDGVAYYTTLNGNTVASDIVTTSTGANINLQNGGQYTTNDTNGPFGYYGEGVRTNSAKFSQAFTNVGGWTANGFITVTDNAAVAPDGTSTAATLTDTSSTQFGSNTPATITVPADSNTHCISMFIKKGSNPGFLCGFNTSLSGGTGVGLNIRFNPETGVLAGATGGVIDFSQTYWRVYYLITNNGSNTSLVNAFFPCTGLAGVSDQASGIGTQTVWGYQVELNASIPSSYIPTTTVAVTRNADVLTYPLLSNMSESAFTVYFSMNRLNNTASSQPTKAPFSVGDYATNAFVLLGGYASTNMTALVDFGTIWNIATGPATLVYGVPTKYTATLASDKATLKQYKDGAFFRSDTSSQAKSANYAGSPSKIYIIGNSAGTDPDTQLTVRHLNLFDAELTAAQVALLPSYLPSQITGAGTITGAGSINDM